MPSASPSLPAPRPHEDAIPHKYLIWQKSQLCQCCGKLHVWSEIFSVALLRPTLGEGKSVLRMTKIDQPRYNLPIDRREDRPASIPFCHACYQPSLRDFPAPPAPARDSEPAPKWIGTKPTAAKTAAKATKPAAAPKITFADFLK
jgi:hypothetical protein